MPDQRSYFKSTSWPGCGLAVLLTALIGCGSATDDNADRGSNPATAAVAEAPASQATVQPANTAGEARASDDGDLLWESPTAGMPIDLAYLPPGVQGFVSWRPAKTFAWPEAAMSFEVLGRWSEAWRASIEQRLGFSLGEVDQLVIGLLDGRLTDAGLGPPRTALVAHCIRPLDPQQLAENAWNRPQLRRTADGDYYQGSDDAWYVPPASNGRWLVVCPLEDIEGLLELAGRAPPMRDELQRLWEQSDSERMFTCALTQGFLATGGKELFAGELSLIGQELDWLIDGAALAFMVSAHVGDNLFAEMRVYTRPDVRAALLERQMQRRLNDSPVRWRQYLADGSPTPYSRDVLARLPGMWQVLVDHARTAHEDRQVVVRAYLPQAASHNLALALYLAATEVADAPGGTASRISDEAAAPESLTATQRLQRRISLSFPRQTLEQAIEQFARECGVPVEIQGGDLQLEGITRNQSFGLKANDLPAAEVLERILRQASPDGKLVYIVQRQADSGREQIIITTQAAAEKRAGEGTSRE